METIHSVKISKIVAFMEDVKAHEIVIRVERPPNYTTDPRKPALVLPGLGKIPVHGGNHRHLVVKLELPALTCADGDCVLESVDLGLEGIKDMIKKQAPSG
jgi:hypothetical protein